MSCPFDVFINDLVQTINSANENQDVHSSIKSVTKTFIADNKQFLRDYVKRELSRNHKSGTTTIYGLADLKDSDFKLSHPRLRLANIYGEHVAHNVGSHIEDKLISIARSLLDTYFRNVDEQIFKFVEQNIVPKIESDLNKLLSESNLANQFTDADVDTISSQCNNPVTNHDIKTLIVDYLHEHHPNIRCQRLTDSEHVSFNKQPFDSSIWDIAGYDMFNTTFL